MSTGAAEEVGKIAIRVVPELGEFRAKMAAEFAKWNDLTVKVKAESVGTEKVREQIKSAAKDQVAKIEATESGASAAAKKIDVAARDRVTKIKVDVDSADMARFERRMAGMAESKVGKHEPTFNLTVADEVLRRQVESKLAELKGLASLPVHLDPEIATRDKIYLKEEYDKLNETLQKHAQGNKFRTWLETGPSPESLKRANDFTAKLREINRLEQESRATAARERDDARQAVAAMDRRADEARVAASRKAAQMDIAAIPGRSEHEHYIADMKVKLDAQDADVKLMEWKAKHAGNLMIPAKIKPDPNMSAFARVKFGLEAMFSNIKVDIKERKSLTTATAEELMGGASAAAKGLANAGSSAAGSLPSLFSFAGMLMLIVAAIAVLLPPLLALSAGFISLAPAMLAFAAPAAAIALGMDGIKKAATDAGLFEDTKPGKKGGGTIGAALQDIKAAVSGEFAAQLTEPFKQLGTLFPVIQESMVGVAGGLSKMATGFIDSVSSGQGLKDVNDIIAKVGVGLSNAAPGVKSFTDGILRLVDGIAQKFPGLGTWFTDLGNKFSSAMTEWTTIPQDNGMTKLENLMANVRTGIEGLTGVFQSFWNQGLKDIQDPNFGKGMTQFFDSVKEFVRDTLPTLSSGFKDIAGLLDSLSPLFKVMNMFSNGLGYFTDTDETLKNTLNRMQEVRDKGGSWLEQVKAGAMETGPGDGPWKTISDSPAAANAGIKGAQNYLKGVQSGLKPGDAIDGSQNMMTGSAVGGINTKATEQGAQVAQQFISGLKTAAGGNLAGGTSEIQAALAKPVEQAVSGLQVQMETLAPQFTGAFNTMKGAVDTGFGAIALLVSARSQALSTAMSEAFSTMPQAMSVGLQGVGPAVNRAMVDAANQVNIGGSQAANTAGVSFQQVAPAIQGAMAGCLTTVASMCEQIVSIMLSYTGAAKSAGTSIGASFAEGLAGATDLVSNSAKALMDAAHLFFPHSPAPEGPFSGRGWVTYSGKSIGEGFANGIGESTDGVVSTVKALMQAVKDVFGDASGLALNFNFGGMQTQMTGLADTAQDFQKSMGSALPAAKPGSSAPGGKGAKIGPETKEALAELQKESDWLGVQIADLKLQKNAAVGKDAKASVQAQMTEMQGRRDVLSDQKKRLEYSAKYGEQEQANNDDQVKMWKELGQKGSEGIQGVAQGVMQSHLQDLGISGQGALGALANYGVGLANSVANKYVFNVSNTQEAQDIKDRETYKQAQGIGY